MVKNIISLKSKLKAKKLKSAIIQKNNAKKYKKEKTITAGKSRVKKK